MEGRDVPRRVASSVLAAALAGRGRLLVVTGEAGIGKTTLVRDVADLAAAHDAQVRWAACWDGGSLLPFGPWIDALGRPGGDRCGAVAVRLADATEQAPDADAAVRARARMFADVLDALGEEASRRAQVIVLEDVHWADSQTLELLRAVARSLPSMAALVIATYRDDELDGAAELAGLGGAAEWLALEGLHERDVATLLAEVLAREPSPDEVRSVHAQTGGNPLFVTQVARLLAASGRPAVPNGVRDVLARRLARLSPAADEVLAVAAVLGRSFDVRDVVAISGAADDVVFGALDEAARARLVRAVEDRADRWTFVHDLVRAARYEALGAAERARLHRQTVEVLAGHATTPAGVLAHHAGRAWFEPGDLRPVAVAVGAAREAMARLAWPEASALCARALEVAPEGVDGDLWRVEAMLAAGDARLRTGDHEAAANTFRDAAALARRYERWDLLARAALGFAAGLASFEVPLMEPRQIALLEEAVAMLPSESSLRPLVLARLSVALSLTGAEERRLELADEAVRLARSGDDDSGLAAAIAARCDAIAGPDHVTERLDSATEIVALAQRAGEVRLELLGRRHRIVALLEMRDLVGFDVEVTAFAAAAARIGDPLYSWYVPLWQAMRAEAAGRLDDAEALARQARSIGTAGGSVNAAMLTRVVVLCIASDRGDVPGLDAAFDDLAASHPELLAPPLQQILTGWLDAEAGRRDGVRHALAALEPTVIARMPRDQEWLALVAQLVTAAAAIGDQAILRAAYEQLLPYAGLGCFEGVAAVDRGVVDRFLALAAGHLGDLAAVERHASVALDAGETAGALVAAHTVADCAQAYAVAGDPSRAAELVADGVARYEALGLDVRSARLRELAEPSPPPRGPGVATLVRDGDTWAFTFNGATARIRHAKGIADIAVLLANSPREVHVRTLEGVDGLPATTSQPALDDAAIAAYRGRVRELDAELDEADDHADQRRSAKLAAERDALVAELTHGLGLGGRRRSAGSDPDDRLRKAVSARIRASIDRLEELHPTLGRHLRHAVHTGYWCSYVPELPHTWQVEQHAP